MTMRELYNWAKENNAEDLEVEIQYRDGGGCYYGSEACETPEITEDCGRKIVLL